MSQQTRREFLDRIAAAGFAGFALSAERAWGLQAVPNPLAVYPNRDWERTYRNLWSYDSTFTFTCAPNDTHNCILNAYVKNGVIARIGPSSVAAVSQRGTLEPGLTTISRRKSLPRLAST